MAKKDRKWRRKLPKIRLRKTDPKVLERAREFVRGKEESKGPVERVTNETVAKHRQEVLTGARRFIYPLQQSKHRIAIISAIIISGILIFFLVLSWYLLYQRQSIGDFAYRMSQIIPFPIARVDGQYVRYEEYLFELRQNVHYLVTQENVDFNTAEGQVQLDGYRRQALDKVIDAAVIRQLANEQGIAVSEQEVEDQINLIRSSGGIGDATQTLEDTLQDFYGWNLADLRRVIKAQLLKQKLIPIFDTTAKPRAETVLEDVLSGVDFAKAAKKYSDDEFTKNNGGSLGFIRRTNTDIPPQIVEKAFSLEAGQTADELVQTLFGYHIVRTNKFRGEDEAQISHILFRFEDASVFVNARKEQIGISRYITLPEAAPQIQSGGDAASLQQRPSSV